MSTILHVITGLGIGGAETILVQVAAALAARGMSQHVVCLTGRGENLEPLEAKGIPVNCLDVRNAYDAPAALFQLCRIFNRKRPSIVQGWMYHGNLMAAFAHRMTPGRSRRRLYWGLRASNMDTKRYGWINGACARVSHWPDVIVANSQAGARWHVDTGYRPRRLEVIANGVDTHLFRPDDKLRQQVRSELRLAPDVFLAIHVARVDPMKDHQTFLSAMAKAPSTFGLLVGDGTQALSLPTNVQALGPRRNLEQIYCAADIVVSSSAFGEGFSNAIAEGMSAGLVPIATDVGDARMIVADTGHIVMPGDSEAMAAAIKAEAGAPREVQVSRGIAARERIRKHFAIETTIAAFENLYSTAKHE